MDKQNIAWDFGKEQNRDLSLTKWLIRTGADIEQKVFSLVGRFNAFVNKKAQDERGMATVEYAVMLVAVAGFAGLMVTLLKSDWAKVMIQGIIEGAFEAGKE